MKNVKQIMIMAAIAIFGITLAACEKEEDMMAVPAAEKTVTSDSEYDINNVNNGTTIVDLVVKSDELQLLEEAVIYAGLAEALTTIENATVFAPTDDAFRAFMRENDFREIEDIPMDVLTSVLLYHTLGEKVFSRYLTEGYLTTLSNSTEGYPMSLYVIPEKGLLNGNINIIKTDIAADNGVVHLIDKVLMPPTVVNHALNNKAFTVLVDAVVKAGLVEALSADGPFTIFAPVNSAFYELFDQMGVDGLAEVPRAALNLVLLSHVASGNVTSDMVQSGYIQTLNPAKRIMVNVSDGRVMLEDDINVVLTDVQGSNGVIHVIDGVIIPSIPTVERDYSDM